MLLSGDFVWKERSAWLRDGWKVGEDKGWVRGSGSSSWRVHCRGWWGAGYTRVLTGVELVRSGDSNGRADFWKGKTLAWGPHLNKPKMSLPAGCTMILYAADKEKQCSQSTHELRDVFHSQVCPKWKSVPVRMEKTQYSFSPSSRLGSFPASLRLSEAPLVLL